MQKLVNPSKINTPFYWWRITSYTAGATVIVDGISYTVDCLESNLCKYHRAYQTLDSTGVVTVEIGDSNDEPYPGVVAKG